ncbi:hypothetical protein C1646_811940 [Rhizophagus diaphanus]|nr:hypothetical protein C1646_811940 [Rhizophagus diaphanus] [Rhizophagus sp. MUCL 43196]
MTSPAYSSKNVMKYMQTSNINNNESAVKKQCSGCKNDQDEQMFIDEKAVQNKEGNEIFEKPLIEFEELTDELLLAIDEHTSSCDKENLEIEHATTPTDFSIPDWVKDYILQNLDLFSQLREQNIQINECGIDATYNTNNLTFELYVLHVEVDSTEYPLGYLFLNNNGNGVSGA